MRRLRVAPDVGKRLAALAAAAELEDNPRQRPQAFADHGEACAVQQIAPAALP